MADHNELGRLGEEMACRYLMHKGYSLVSRNWTCHPLEIDIVADWFGEIVFVEVKTRQKEDIELAIDAVDLKKRKNLVMAAKAYMNYYKLEAPYRFDIITVVGQAPDFTIKHYINAFTPEGVQEESQMRKYRQGGYI